jgi:hypothetical protein
MLKLIFSAWVNMSLTHVGLVFVSISVQLYFVCLIAHVSVLRNSVSPYFNQWTQDVLPEISVRHITSIWVLRSQNISMLLLHFIFRYNSKVFNPKFMVEILLYLILYYTLMRSEFMSLRFCDLSLGEICGIIIWVFRIRSNDRWKRF